MKNLQSALTLVDRFEAGKFVEPSEAESLIVEVFQTCGCPVIEKGFAVSEHALLEVDCFIRTKIDESLETIAIEIKAAGRQAGLESVEQAFRLKTTGPFDRAMILSRLGFSAEALRHADTVGLGKIDLLQPNDLRAWLSKQAEAEQDDSEQADTAYERIVRTAMRQLVELIARRPETLVELEWRELEKVLREAFEGIGFETKLTRPGKDGGFDLELTATEGGRKQIYLVEVKHWAEARPGMAHVRKFVEVTASRQATAGIFLSTSGFTKPLYRGITEFTEPMYLGESNKVVSLCKTYFRLRSAMWIEDVDLQATLLSETRSIGIRPITS